MKSKWNENDAKDAATVLYATLEAAHKFLSEYENESTPLLDKALGMALFATANTILHAVSDKAEIDPDDLRDAVATAQFPAREFSRFIQRGEHNRFPGSRMIAQAAYAAAENALKICSEWYDSWSAATISAIANERKAA